MNEYFRGVIWPRPPQKGQFRYVVVGMIVTDHPLENLSGDQIVLDGYSGGMADAINGIYQKESDFRGDANSVLLGLKDLV